MHRLIDPAEVGADGSKIVLTARSGRSALAHRLRKLGYEFNRDDVDTLYGIFLKVADTKKEIDNEDLHAISKQYQSSTETA
jgi:2-isopropylmalate synthase